MYGPIRKSLILNDLQKSRPCKEAVHFTEAHMGIRRVVRGYADVVVRPVDSEPAKIDWGEPFEPSAMRMSSGSRGGQIVGPETSKEVEVRQMRRVHSGTVAHGVP